MEITHFWEYAKNDQILLILSGSKEAQKAVKALDDGSWLWLSDADLSRGRFPLAAQPIMVYPNTMDNLVSAFSVGTLTDNCLLFQEILKGVIWEFNPDQGDFSYYTCGVVVMPCCTGQYLKIVNRKEIKG